MKITAIAHGGTPGASLSNTSQNTDRMAAAKAIAAGETPIRVNPSDTPIDPELRQNQNNIRRIKMRTNVSPDRFDGPPAQIPADAKSAITDTNVQADAVNEVTKPIDPQLAALAKQRRALQVKERELADKEKAIASMQPKNGGEELIARLKSKPLSVLQEYGVTYDQLTEAILANSDGNDPKIQELEAKIKALEQGIDNKLLTRDQHAEQQVLIELLAEAELLAKEGDDFSLIRDEDESAYREVLTRIYNTYKKEGTVRDVKTVMAEVENELLEKRYKLASHAKVQSRFAPIAQPSQPMQRQNYMRTLTNRDSTSLGLSRKDRALMAFNGTLKKG